jgi:signal transduction histidine kinase
MTESITGQDEGQLAKAYHKYDCELRYRYLLIGLIISMVGVPMGFTLDWLIYPERIWQFVGIRMGVDAALLVIFVLLILSKNLYNLTLLKIYSVATVLVINLVFCAMIMVTNGAKSPYYAGISLILAAFATLTPWTVVEAATACVTSYFAYILACVINAGWSATFSERLLYSNSFFLIFTGLVCVTASYYLARARFDDFQLRHQLDEQNRELQDLDRLKTQFFSNISHELRTPLTLILGPAETLLSEHDELDRSTHENLMVIHRNSLRLLKLINDLLDLTRLDQGSEVLRRQNLQAGIFLKGIVDSVRHLGMTKQLRLRVEEGDSSLMISADPSRMEKVVVNLLTNAIKYTKPGGQITLRWYRKEAGTAMEVEDTGVGIPEEDLPRVFDRFHQVRSNATNQTQGVGIGLALAKELVQAHGGQLEVESEVGRGSKFRIYLPDDAIPVDAEAVPAVEETPEEVISISTEPFEKAFRSADRSWRSNDQRASPDMPVVGQGDSTILVADDETDMRQYVVSLLSAEHKIVQTPTGDNVVELVQKHNPELVLLDWMMPGKDGLSVCRELRAMPKYRDLKIVLVTARIDEKSKLDALDAGADDFLTKPFSSVELRTRAANLIRAARLQGEIRQRNQELTETINKLQLTEARLIQSEKMNAIGSLSAGLLHEINNPLNYALTAIDIAYQFRDTLTPDMKEIIEDVQDGMIRIRDVITHLKNFAYPEKPGTESYFKISEVVLSARKIVAKEVEDVQVEVDLPDELVVFGQKTQLTHLFMNLLSNAGKALHEKPPQGRPMTIKVKGTAVNDSLVVTFQDNGPGIPEEIRDRIFEPFFTTRDVGAGMGMGLSVCHTIIESHRGAIDVRNADEGGALFTITLPREKETANLC